MSETKNIRAVFQIVWPVLESLGADFFFGQTKPKDHGAHGSVKDQNLLLKAFEKQFGSIGLSYDRHDVALGF